MDHLTLKTLLDKYLADAITEEERQQLNTLLSDPQHRKALEELMDKELQENAFEANADDRLLVLIQSNIREKIKQERRPGKLVRFSMRKIAVAASFLLMVGIGSYMLFRSKPAENVAIVHTPAPTIVNDVVPGDNRAILKLADGSEIILDSAANGTLTQQGDVKVIKLNDGRLAYQPKDGSSTEVLYNTIYTPRGGQYQLVLADGTKVWLNAASSLRFPAYFTGDKRDVEVTGEAYFEVAKNTSMPFRVRTGEVEIEVLGTHFNVNAYPEEQGIRTTLIEGSVNVSRAGQKKLLRPGQQAATGSEGQIQVMHDVDMEEVMAWKNGLFHFKSADLESILRQAERWYDVEFNNKKAVKARFSGEIPRKVNLSQLLKILESTDKVHFKIEGKKVLVNP